MKVISMYVNFDIKDEAKKLGCRWDDCMKCWYVSLEKYNANKESFEKFRILALVDIDNVSAETMKELNCAWNPRYKKWTVNKLEYGLRKTEFDLHNLQVLSEITNVFNFVPPPVKSQEDQLAELIALMSYDEDN
jgi:hypothetical protein